MSNLLRSHAAVMRRRIDLTPASILGSDLVSEYTAEDAVVTSAPDIDSIPAIAPDQDSGSLTGGDPGHILDIGGVQFADFASFRNMGHTSQSPTLYPTDQTTLCMWTSCRIDVYSAGEREVTKCHGFAKGLSLFSTTNNGGSVAAGLGWNFALRAIYNATPADVNVWMCLYDATDLTLWQNNVLRATDSAHAGEEPGEVGENVTWSLGAIRFDGAIRRHVCSLGVPTSGQRAQMQTYMAADAGI